MSGALSDSVAMVMQYLLVGESVGTLPEDGDNWPIFVGFKPDSPDSVIVLTDTTGVKDGRDMTSGEQFMHYGFQVLVRATTYPVGWAKAHAIAVVLDESVDIENIEVGDNRYIVYAVSRQGGVLSLGREPGSQRPEFSFNCTVALRQAV